jgi:hypothetical protein
VAEEGEKEGRKEIREITSKNVTNDYGVGRVFLLCNVPFSGVAWYDINNRN